MTRSWGEGGREGGRCCDQVPEGGGVVTMSRRGGRCCEQVLGGGREVL